MTCEQGLLHLLWGGARSWSATALTTTTILIKKRIGIGYKNYKTQCPGLEFRLITPYSLFGIAGGQEVDRNFC